MALHVRVISQRPPGGRCTLYAGYADALARYLGAHAEVVFNPTRDAHGEGFPSLWLNDTPVQPADGVIVMPTDITTALAACGASAGAMSGLAAALEKPLERMLEGGQEP
jgi:cystathionine gamma-synthase